MIHSLVDPAVMAALSPADRFDARRDLLLLGCAFVEVERDGERVVSARRVAPAEVRIRDGKPEKFQPKERP